MIKTIITQSTEQTEQQFVGHWRTEYDKASSAANWMLGEAAAIWVTTYARGRTDGEFAKLFGVSRSHVANCRSVFETFGMCSTVEHISWSHHREAMNWEDAKECLQWAADNGATLQELTAYHNVKNGIEPKKPKKETDLRQADTTPITTQADEPNAPIVTPKEDTPNPPATQPITPVKQKTATTQQPTQPGESSADPVVAIRHICEDDANRDKVIRQIWRLLRELDPEPARQAKPTVAAMLAVIPDEWPEKRKEAATRWAKWKKIMTGKAKIQAMFQWETILESMAEHDAAAVLESVKYCVSNGYQGWTFGLDKKPADAASARVHNKDPDRKVVYRDFD